jgi:hypothetical protein
MSSTSHRRRPPFDPRDTEADPSGVRGWFSVSVHAPGSVCSSIRPRRRDAVAVWLCEDRPELDQRSSTRRWRGYGPGGSVVVVLLQVARVRWGWRLLWVVLDNDRRDSHGQQWWFTRRTAALDQYQRRITEHISSGRTEQSEQSERAARGDVG